MPSRRASRRLQGLPPKNVNSNANNSNNGNGVPVRINQDRCERVVIDKHTGRAKQCSRYKLEGSKFCHQHKPGLRNKVIKGMKGVGSGVVPLAVPLAAVLAVGHNLSLIHISEPTRPY